MVLQFSTFRDCDIRASIFGSLCSGKAAMTEGTVDVLHHLQILVLNECHCVPLVSRCLDLTVLLSCCDTSMSGYTTKKKVLILNKIDFTEQVRCTQRKIIKEIIFYFS